MNKGSILSISIWLIIVALSLLWNIKQERQQFEELALQSARSFFEQILITREWSARHGGAYVPVTATTAPNPYLKDQLRDLKISSDLQLTKINPSYMTRQLSELASDKQGIQFHITSLKPIRPQNQANSWEAATLLQFEGGLQERGEFFHLENASVFRYMAPLITEKPCLKCHPDNKEGDIRGGISIISPTPSPKTAWVMYMGHSILGISGIAGILLFWHMLGKAYDKIHRQAVVDSLTGVANRRRFSQKILEEFKRSRRNNDPLSVLMCDIDNFKAYNDNYGHTEGDKCLSLVAKTIQNSIRRPSDFCARYGGEEFVLILPDTGMSGALKVAETVLENIRQLQIMHKTVPLKIITLSIGIATTYKRVIDSHEELVKQADTALYLAKNNGKNRAEIYKDQTTIKNEKIF